MVLLNNFIDKENVKVLWEILVEEGVVPTNHSNKIRDIFENNMVDFYNSERSRTSSLIEMDKKYIAAMIQFLKNPNNQNIHPNNPQNNSQNNQYPPHYKKIKIEEEIKHPITFEEIQNEKRNKFDTQLQEKQKEFTNALLTPVPPTPNFKDNDIYNAPPISELENEIKRMQEQRKYDLTNIQYNEEHAKKEWLKAIDTNINISKDLNNPLNNSLKDLTNSNSKHVTWAPNINILTENTFIDASFNHHTHTRSSSEYTYLMEEIYTLKNRISDLEDRVREIIK
jgi:hypothetical protein